MQSFIAVLVAKEKVPAAESRLKSFDFLAIPCIALCQISVSAQTVSDPYCGVYSVYAGLKTLGKKPQLDSLVNEKYVGSGKGSTIYELEQAIEEHGAFALSVKNLFVSDLRQLEYPAILHVKSSPAIPRPDHFILSIPTSSSSRGVFLDLPEVGLYRDSYESLAPIWGGAVVIISDRPLTTYDLLPGRLPLLLSVGLFVIIVTSVTWFVRQREILRRPSRRTFFIHSFAGVPLFLAVSGIAGYSLHSSMDGGLIDNQKATQKVLDAYEGSFVPRVRLGEMQRAASEGSAVIIDARWPFDYETGHIPSAINVSPGSSEDEWRSALEGINPDEPIFIYCQSASCPYSERLALKLKHGGMSNIHIYTNGWSEWIKHAAIAAQNS